MRLWVDQGGTFTDIVRWGPGGLSVEKRLGAGPVDRGGARVVRQGTTVATNALLERRGVPTLLLVDRGLGELVGLRDGTRPALFGLDTPRPPPLCAEIIEVDGRIGLEGGRPVLLRPHALAVEALIAARGRGLEAVAVVFAHGPLLPEEERRVGALCRAAGFTQVSLGHEVAPGRGLLARLETTLVDAATSPLLPRAPGEWMTSEGGLVPVGPDGQGALWRGSRAILSGPAGGAVACAELARLAGQGPAFGLDMGGTSTDVCRVDGEPERVERLRIGGIELGVPAVRIHTIAAGGGSRLRRVGGVYQVGPDSAGASPGPACHARGGPATVTDAEALLGRLPGFPAIAGPTRDQPLDVEAARRALVALDPARAPEEVAEGFLEVAVEAMARAVRALAAALGVDPARHALVAFGGAGPGHAAAVARRLGIERVLLPDLAGVFSAVGVGLARPRLRLVVPVSDGVEAAIAQGRAALPAEAEGAALRVLVALRHRGTRESLLLPWLEGVDLRARFDEAHRRRFGFHRPEQEIEAVEVHLVAEHPEPVELPPGPRLPPLAERTARIWLGGWQEVPLRRPEEAHNLLGPALILGAGFTALLPPGFRAERHGGFLLLRDMGPPPRRLGLHAHPVDTALFAIRIAAIAEAMGERLARLARSVSIRERRDFSCAVFDAEGWLLANAPHVPVHLGAMGHTVRELLAHAGEELRSGRAWASNDPYAGGSHLPDITVVMPVFVGGRRVAFVACRGHHVDVGGITPGSMPPHARRLDEEGFLLRHQLLLDEGRWCPPPLPGCRQPAEVLADLQAQVAACRLGAEGIAALHAEVSGAAFAAQAGHVRDQAEAAVREVLAGLAGRFAATGRLDAGPEPPWCFRVELAVEANRARLHLRGPPHPGNLNAPRAVSVAVLLYVFRCLVERQGGQGAELPLNDGALRPFALELEGLFDPGPPAAVAGGNVETSQRLADALLLALGAQAEGQGTMNNLCLGFEDGALYETLAGGGGAGPGFSGLDASQIHMTNTRATDLEELEARFPLRLLRVGRRAGSGGAGRWRGGEGMVKEWELLAPAEVSLLAGRRREPARGLDGGGPGATGLDEVDTGEGFRPFAGLERLPAGARLRIQTPGGGGCGRPDGEGG